jgi:hypothetical protein
VVEIVEHLVGEKKNFGGIAIVGEPRVPQLHRQHAGLEPRHEHVPEMFKGYLRVRFQNAAADRQGDVLSNKTRLCSMKSK